MDGESKVDNDDVPISVVVLRSESSNDEGSQQLPTKDLSSCLNPSLRSRRRGVAGILPQSRWDPSSSMTQGQDYLPIEWASKNRTVAYCPV